MVLLIIIGVIISVIVGIIGICIYDLKFRYRDSIPSLTLKEYKLLSQHADDQTMHLLLGDWTQSKGPFKIHAQLFKPPAVVISDPEDLKTIFVTEFESMTKKELYTSASEYFGETSFFTNEGEYWRQLRKFFNPGFSHHNIKNMVSKMHLVYHEFIEILEQCVGQPSVDISVLLNRLSLDQNGLISFGASFGALHTNKYDHTLDNIWAHINNRSIAPLPYWRLFATKEVKQYRIALAQVDEMLSDIIKKRKAMGIKNEDPDFLAQMLLAQETGAYNFSPKQLRDQCATFLNGGTDTMRSTFVSLVYLVAKHPEVESKILEEVNRVIPNERMPTWEDITKLEYCAWVVKEVLRMNPPANFFGKTNTKPLTLRNGVTVPPGYSLIVAAYPMHHNPKYYKDPDTFNPERWSAQNSQQNDSCAFFTFSAGPSNCPGFKVAYLEGKMFLATIYKRFQLKIVGTEPKLSGRVILRYPFLDVKIVKRNGNK